MVVVSGAAKVCGRQRESERRGETAGRTRSPLAREDAKTAPRERGVKRRRRREGRGREGGGVRAGGLNLGGGGSVIPMRTMRGEWPCSWIAAGFER